MPRFTAEAITIDLTAPRFRDAFIRLSSKLSALPQKQYLQINLDVTRSVTTVLGALPQIRAMRAELAHHIPTFDIAILDDLETYALALGHAQTLYKTAAAPRPSLIALGAETEKVRAIFLADIRTQIARGVIDATATKDLKGGNGYKNIASDVFALSSLLRNGRSKTTGRTTVTMEELDAAEILAQRLVTAVAERDQAPAIASEAARNRQGAYTLLINAYDEVRWALAFLRRKEGDLDDIAPSLYLGRSGDKKKDLQAQPRSNETIFPVSATGTTLTTAQPLASPAV